MGICAPPVLTLTRSVWFDWRSWTNTSCASLVSPATKFVDRELNVTYRPSADIASSTETNLSPTPRSACTPPEPTLTRSVVLPRRSRTKASSLALVSAATRFVALDAKTRKRPFPEKLHA